MPMTTSNRLWAERIINRIDADFKHRWEVFDDTLLRYLTPTATWVDVGCGNNSLVHAFGSRVHSAVGVDLLEPAEPDPLFLQGDIRNLPLPNNHADVVSLRFVVEHLQNVDRDFADVFRVLKPGGVVVLVTTNLWNPFIFIPRLLLPPALKHKIIEKLFKVSSDDIFRAYHVLNSPPRFHKGIQGFALSSIQYISDLNYTRKWLFSLFMGWHILTMPTPLHQLRTNVVAVYQKVAP